MIYSDAVPNPAHRALARLEADGRLRAVVTQNIDGLHQAAGSRQVLELHGSVHRNYCMDCRQTFSLKEVMDSPGPVPHCDRCGGMVRPDVVLYGETLDPLVIEAAIGYIRSADLLLIAGTSLTVQPAAGLVSACRDGRMILVNRTPTPFDKEVGLVIRDPVGRVLAAVTDMLSLKNQGSKEPDGPAERL
jgi:NAD-dependent deacetylase